MREQFRDGTLARWSGKVFRLTPLNSAKAHATRLQKMWFTSSWMRLNIADSMAWQLFLLGGLSHIYVFDFANFPRLVDVWTIIFAKFFSNSAPNAQRAPSLRIWSTYRLKLPEKAVRTSTKRGKLANRQIEIPKCPPSADYCHFQGGGVISPSLREA